jgi:hypothetical protein
MLLSVLTLCGVLGGACPDRLASAMPRLSPLPRSAMAADSVRIEYLCGNQFRVMHYDTARVYVSWDVAESADSVQHDWMPGRVAGFPYISLIYTTRTKGTFRLFAKGRLIGSAANGGKACPPDLTEMRDSLMPESWRKLSDDEKGAALLILAAVMNDPEVRFGPLGPLTGRARILYDSLVAAEEAMLDSASANLAFERSSCLFNRARNTFGGDSLVRIATAAERAVQAKHTRAELEAGRKGIAFVHDFADDAYCVRIDSLWYARAAKLRMGR